MSNVINFPDKRLLSNVIRQYVKLTNRSGCSCHSHWSGICPFHKEKTPSFTVDDESGTFRCLSCGAQGNAFNFVIMINLLELMEMGEI